MSNNISIIIFGDNISCSVSRAIGSTPQISEVILIGDNLKDKFICINENITIKIVEIKKCNLVDSVLKGLSKAKGELSVIINGEFDLSEELLAKTINRLKTNKIDFIYGGFKLDNLLPKIWVISSRVYKNFISDNFRSRRFEDILINILTNVDIASEKYIIKNEKTFNIFDVFSQHNIIGLYYLLKLKLICWFQDRKSLYFIVGIFVALLIYLSFSFYNINEPFIHVSADTNGDYGTAAINLAQFGFFKLKFGIHFGLLTDLSNIGFYTHHPSFFVIPTAILYKLFGVSELTTRLAPLFLIFFSSIIFTFALRKIFDNIWPSLISILIYGLLPGVIFYGKTFEMAVFSLPAALMTFSFFIFFVYSKKLKYFYLFLISIVVGGLVGWFYYLMVVSIWLFLLLTKKGKQTYKRNLLLFLIPIILGITYILVFLHFYILNGSGIFLDMFNQFKIRTSRQLFGAWWSRIGMLLNLEITWIFLLTFIGGLITWLYEQRKNKNLLLLLPILIWPLLVFVIFFQWSTHPFGVIYTFPVIAVISGYFLWWLVCKIKIYGLFIMAVILVGGVYLSWQNQQYFYNEFVILTKSDIELVKQFKDKVDHYELCLGGNSMGLSFNGIGEWYLGKKVNLSPTCLDDQESKAKTKFGIVFHPQLGDFYKKEVENFTSKGFKITGCTGGYWCLMEK